MARLLHYAKPCAAFLGKGTAQCTSAIALRMAGVGFVTVSLRKSIIFPLGNVLSVDH